jgi:hypothetical protein
MAVYQISRIQIRRGQANTGTGLPQLASGEMAWAIDTQELYIGSGAVSEGAPGVSNIKVITQQDLTSTGNLISLVQYTYKSSDATVQTGSSTNSPIYRVISDRLDDQVSAKDFGTVGNNVIDDTAALQRAINELFLNPSAPANNSSNSNRRVTLVIPAGSYYTSSTIYVPSYATIVGEGIDKTIINYNPAQSTFTGSTGVSSPILLTSAASSSMLNLTITGPGVPSNTYITTVNPGVSVTLSNNASSNNSAQVYTLTNPAPAIQFVNDSSTLLTASTVNPDPSVATSTTQPRKIKFKDLSVNCVYSTSAVGLNTALQLNSVKDSYFEKVYLSGAWNGAISSNSVGLNMSAVSSLVTCENNIFNDVRVTGFNYGAYTQLDILNNAFDDCYFSTCLVGLSLGIGGGITLANPYGPRQTTISDTKFYNIFQEAVYIGSGYGNGTFNCKYTNVGNNGSNNALAQFPQVYFTTYGNTSQNDQSDRHLQLGNPNTGTNTSGGTYALAQYVPEVAGHGTYSYFGTNEISISQTSTYTPILKLPLNWLPSTSDRTTGPTGQIVYEVTYYYFSLANAYTRQGTIRIAADVVNKQVQLNDDYLFTNESQVDDSNALLLDFQAEFVDNTGTVTTSNPWSIVITYANTQSGEAGLFNYTYKAVF